MDLVQSGPRKGNGRVTTKGRIRVQVSTGVQLVRDIKRTSFEFPVPEPF